MAFCTENATFQHVNLSKLNSAYVLPICTLAMHRLREQAQMAAKLDGRQAQSSLPGAGFHRSGKCGVETHPYCVIPPFNLTQFGSVFFFAVSCLLGKRKIHAECFFKVCLCRHGCPVNEYNRVLASFNHSVLFLSLDTCWIAQGPTCLLSAQARRGQ